MDDNYDVIMFYGPPFGGKTAYFHHILRSTHQRVSATELFDENPEFGLRQVILKIASLLRDGKKVVIDDENWTKATRISYVKTLSAKFPRCKFLCLKFNPEELVSYWSLEWYLAEKVLQNDFTHMTCDLKKATKKLYLWFDKNSDEGLRLKLEEPRQDERMTVKVVKPKLLAQLDYKFEVPALFLQWKSVIVSTDGSDSIHTGLVDVINCWLNANPWGRVIIIFDSVTTETGSTNSDSSKDLHIDSYKSLLSRLCKNMTVPVYTFQIQTSESERKFCCPPQPGILAFLQRLHHLDLFHRYTLYLHCTNDHYKMADEAGVKHVATKSVLCNPQMIVGTNCAAKVTVKHELKDIDFKMRMTGQRSSAVIPFFTKAQQESSLDGIKYYEELSPWKCMNGICFQDFSIVERYQQLYVDTASLLSEPGSKMHPPAVKIQNNVPEPSVQSHTKTEITVNQPATGQSLRGSRAIPSWLMSKNSKQNDVDDIDHAASPSLDSSLEDQPVKKKKKTVAQPSTIYCMNVLELLETAQLVLLENGKTVPSSVNLTKTSPESNKPVKPTKSESVDSTNEKNIDETAQYCLPTKASSRELKQHVVPETITTIPETEGFQSAVFESKGNIDSPHPPVKSNASQLDTSVEKAPVAGPDLSFLDDIF